MKKKFKTVNDRDDRKISQEQFQEKTSNIYESVMVLGQRMRQIERKNASDFEKIKEDVMNEQSEKEYNREYLSELIEEELPVFPKAIRVAMNEMLNDELEWEYEDLTKLEN